MKSFNRHYSVLVQRNNHLEKYDTELVSVTVKFNLKAGGILKCET